MPRSIILLIVLYSCICALVHISKIFLLKVCEIRERRYTVGLVDGSLLVVVFGLLGWDPDRRVQICTIPLLVLHDKQKT